MAEDAAGAVLKDDKVSSLQTQIKWFRHEAIKLDEIINKQAREIAKLEARKGMVHGDRGFIKQQVKDAMKQNNQIKLAVKKTEDTNKAIRDFLVKNTSNKNLTRSIELYRRPVGESNDNFKQILEDRSATVQNIAGPFIT